MLLTPKQLSLDLAVEKEVEVNGIGMGVFSDGMPYLTGRGLARFCGVDQKAIVQVTSALAEGIIRPREAKIAELLEKHGIDPSQPYVIVDNETERYNAFPAPACMAFLEYYAFEAGPNIRQQAVTSFRALAQKGLRDFILTTIGYDPNEKLNLAWRQFRDRITVTYGALPEGYFIVFKEIADMIATLIIKGASIGIHFIPDISVGRTWSDHWSTSKFEDRFGSRIKTLHNYPDYFPQAKSNPQEIYAYPEDSLPEFRRWARQTYLPHKLPSYLSKKVKDGLLSITAAQSVQVALTGPDDKEAD
jgi:hypothetical protein